MSEPDRPRDSLRAAARRALSALDESGVVSPDDRAALRDLAAKAGEKVRESAATGRDAADRAARLVDGAAATGRDAAEHARGLLHDAAEEGRDLAAAAERIVADVTQASRDVTETAADSLRDATNRLALAGRRQERVLLAVGGSVTVAFLALAVAIGRRRG
jgi:hypothetical protein